MPEPIRQRITSAELNEKLISIQNFLKRDYLRFWQVHAPHFTDHGEDHCEAVERILSEFIPTSTLSAFHQYEVFMLIAAAWLHDIGMMVSAKAGETDETIREHHHERSREFIRRKLGPILNRKERACIAEIAYAHRMRVDITKIPQHQVITHPTLGSVNIRVQFLGGLLRLADVLDICYTRTGEFVDESRLSVLASFYHSIHERVSGITYNSGEGIIEIHIDARNKKEQMTLDKYIINEVQEELDSVQKVLARNGLTYVEAIANYSLDDSLRKIIVPESLLQKEGKFDRTRLDAARAVEGGNPRLAIAKMRKLVKTKTPSVRDFMLLAFAYRKGGKIEDAVTQLKSAIRLEPTNVNVMNSLGHTYGEYALDSNEALTWFKKAYETSPDDEIFALDYAEALLVSGDCDTAGKLAETVLQSTTDLIHYLNGNLILIWCDFLSDKIPDGKMKLRSLVETLPPAAVKRNTWVYNLISSHIKGSSLDDGIKTILLGLIDVVTQKVPISEYRERLRGSA